MRKFLIVINKFLALLFYDDIKYIILKIIVWMVQYIRKFFIKQ